MRRYRVYDIDYDIDYDVDDTTGEEAEYDLPSELVIVLDDDDNIIDDGANIISDITGWCVNSFKYEKV